MQSTKMDTTLPTLAKKNAALIGINTPRGEEDIYSYLCNQPDPARDMLDPVAEKAGYATATATATATAPTATASGICAELAMTSTPPGARPERFHSIVEVSNETLLRHHMDRRPLVVPRLSSAPDVVFARTSRIQTRVVEMATTDDELPK
jgi:hypothetical protein